MAYSTLTISFPTTPSSGEILNISETLLGLNLNEVFHLLRSGSGTTATYAGVGTQAVYYKTAFDLDYNTTGLFTTSVASGVITITATYENAVFVAGTNTSDAVVTITNYVVTPDVPDPIIPIVLDDVTILSRSPYNITITPPVLFDAMSVNLYLYKGHKTTDKPTLATYSLSKSVVIAGQTKIGVEISKIVNDLVKNNYTQTLGGGSNTTSTKDSLWCYVEITMKYLEEPVYYVNQTLYVLDGFGYHTELANPTIDTNVLSSITDHVFYNGSVYPLYFKTKNLNSITINGTSVSFTYSQNYNNQLVGMVNIGAYTTTTGTFDAVFVYSTGTETHSFEVKEECKYPIVNCIFKNKYGFWQNIPFNKLSKKTIDFESQDFMPIVSSFGTYSLNSHNKKNFLNNGKEKITVNTDFLKENYNDLFKELMLSEFVYLEESGTVYPVNLLKKTFETKTKLINKLIQYSMDFEYSFNLMNTVI